MSGGIKGGNKITARLKQMQEELGRNRKVEVGFFANSTYTDGTPVAMIAAIQEFGTDKIPARSFMRTTIADKQAQWAKAAAAVMRATGCNPQQALEQLGAVAANDIQEKIKAITDPPLAPYTIKRRREKGSENPEKPLIDTGRMVESVSYQVSDD